MDKERITFPFEPNEKVKAAFRNQQKLEQMTRLITNALIAASTDYAVNPWDILYKEHPELKEMSRGLLRYNCLWQTVDLETKAE